MATSHKSSAMKEMTMLDLHAIDLDTLELALEDNSGHGQWWIDPETGRVWFASYDDPNLDDDEGQVAADARAIEPLPSRFGYGDMEDFLAHVADPRAADLLGRAIAGRGAFRRFKDTLVDFPELRELWFRFRDTRSRRRAIEFLVDESIVSDADARQTLAGLADPPLPEAPVVPRQVAENVAADLRQHYGSRLAEVVLYGSHARGDGHPDSDLDLAVVICDMASPWDELKQMDDILWRHTLESGITVSAFPVSAADWAGEGHPMLRSARAEGVLLR